MDRIPTMKTSNCRMCLLLATGQMGMLMIEDAERLQARPPATPPRRCPLSISCTRALSWLRVFLPNLAKVNWLYMQACDVRPTAEIADSICQYKPWRWGAGPAAGVDAGLLPGAAARRDQPPQPAAARGRRRAPGGARVLFQHSGCGGLGS